VAIPFAAVGANRPVTAVVLEHQIVKYGIQLVSADATGGKFRLQAQVCVFRFLEGLMVQCHGA
jgi:hypothetical protein